jgi:hypothetical protein
MNGRLLAGGPPAHPQPMDIGIVSADRRTIGRIWVGVRDGKLPRTELRCVPQGEGRGRDGLFIASLA